MTLEELTGGLPKYCYIEQSPFAQVRDTKVHWVMIKSRTTMDLRIGVAMFRGERGIFIPSEELPVLSDVVAGVVTRGNLS